jgi:hypothetical protein
MSAVRLPMPESVQDELADIFEFWSPSEVRTYVTNVGAGYTNFATDLGNNPTVFSAEETAAWARTLSNFLDFYKNVGWFSSLSMSPVRSAETFAAQLAFYRQLYQQKSGKAPTGANIIIPSQNQDKALDVVRLAAIAAGLAAGGYLLAQVLGIARTAIR